jgi:hypothetical protein
MKDLLYIMFCLLLTVTGRTQTIPPSYINYQAILYDVNGPNPNAPYALQSFPSYVNINDELGNLLYREEHYSSTDANGQVTIKIGDGLYLTGPITNFNQINWASGKYYLVVEFDINGTISATAPEQLVTVPYAFYAGNSGSGISSINDNGNGTLTFTYNNGSTYVTPILSGLMGPVGPTGSAGPQGPTGATGPQGPAGVNGLNALIKTTTEPSGTNCANGGTKIETGLDANENGVLDLSEINTIQTKYLCNGTDVSGIQTLTLSGTNLSIQPGNSVDLAVIQDGVNDADSDPTNEIQTWSTLPGVPSILNKVVGGTVRAPNGVPLGIIAGSNFSVTRPNVGMYTITFSSPFQNTPIVVANCNMQSGNEGYVLVYNVSTTGFSVYTKWEANMALSDAIGFSFIALGN